MSYNLFATQHLRGSTARFRHWPSVLLIMLIAFGWKSATAQSSAGSLRCGAPSGNSATSSTPTTTKKNSKVDQFNAIQQQEVKNQQAIQNAGDDILNGLKGSGKSDLKSDDDADDDSDDSDDSASTGPMESSPAEATSGAALSDAAPPLSNSAAAVNSLLDDPSKSVTTSNSAAVNSLLKDSSQQVAQPNSAAVVSSLLGNQAAGTAPSSKAPTAQPLAKSNDASSPHFQQTWVAFAFSYRTVGISGDGAWGAFASSDSLQQTAINGAMNICESKTSKPGTCSTGGLYGVCQQGHPSSWVALAMFDDGVSITTDGEGIRYDTETSAQQAALAICSTHGACSLVWTLNVDCGAGTNGTGSSR